MGAAVLTGFGLGFFIAAQVGPIWLLSARTVLRGAYRSGLAIGAAAAVVDVVYATLGVLGAGRLLEVDALRVTFGLLGAAVLVVLGVRSLHHAARIRGGGETDDEVLTPPQAFRTTLVAMASNPQTIAYWAAVFTAASTSDVTTSTGPTVALLGAVGAGTLGWNVVQTGMFATVGRRLPDRAFGLIDALSGLGILAFGGVLGWKTLRD